MLSVAVVLPRGLSRGLLLLRGLTAGCLLAREALLFFLETQGRRLYYYFIFIGNLTLCMCKRSYWEEKENYRNLIKQMMQKNLYRCFCRPDTGSDLCVQYQQISVFNRGNTTCFSV